MSILTWIFIDWHALCFRLNDILAGKTREIADLANPYPPERISQLFKELFKTLRNDAFSFYKSEMGMKESECAAKTLSILHVCNYVIQIVIKYCWKLLKNYNIEITSRYIWNVTRTVAPSETQGKSKTQMFK